MVVAAGALGGASACTFEPSAGEQEAPLFEPPPLHCGASHAMPAWVLSETDSGNSDTITKITWVPTRTDGPEVAVRIEIPPTGRYEGLGTIDDPGATMPIVLDTPRFMDDATWETFGNSLGFTEAHRIGAITVSFLKPGMRTRERANPSGFPTWVCSDGVFDGGAETSREYLQVAAEFATGARADRWGNHITDLAPHARTSNVGVYASSHAGMLALRAFASYGLDDVDYFVGWENPLADVYLTGELGRVVEGDRVFNLVDDYAYGSPRLGARPYESGDYDADFIHPTAPFLAVTGDGLPRLCPYAPAPDHSCYQTDGTGGIFDGYGHSYDPGPRLSVMSAGLTLRTCETLCQVDLCNAAAPVPFQGVCPTWPTSMASPGQVNEWKRRAMLGAILDNNGGLTPFNHFGGIVLHRATMLHAMLVFHEYDHKSGEPTKPKIEQAYSGLRSRANAWVRLNPDRAYLRWVFDRREDLLLTGRYRFTDNLANLHIPSPWSEAQATSLSIVVPTNADYTIADLASGEDPEVVAADERDRYGRFKEYTKLAALAEMMDRTEARDWSDDLVDILYGSCPATTCPGLAPP